MIASRVLQSFCFPIERLLVVTKVAHSDEIRMLVPGDVTLRDVMGRLLERVAKGYGVEYVDFRNPDIRIVFHAREEREFLRVRLKRSCSEAYQVLVLESDWFISDDGDIFGKVPAKNYRGLGKFLSERFEVEVDDIGC